jgi:hypothetical protein
VEKVAVAVPPLPLRVPVPIVVAPFLNVTVPVGVFGPPDFVTVAVKVTVCPEQDGLLFEETVVVELFARPNAFDAGINERRNAGTRRYLRYFIYSPLPIQSRAGEKIAHKSSYF